jgi:hydrogenase expression/formation protein HypC
MCLALPAEVIALKNGGESATVSLEGVKKNISLALVDDVTVGDYVLVHVGFALAKLSAEEAAETLAMMAEAGVPVAGSAEEIGGAA